MNSQAEAELWRTVGEMGREEKYPQVSPCPAAVGNRWLVAARHRSQLPILGFNP